jgi:hypothetical protein
MTDGEMMTEDDFEALVAAYGAVRPAGPRTGAPPPGRAP